MTESQQPNPFSREGSSSSDGLDPDSSPEQTTPYPPLGIGSNDRYASDWPSYPAEYPAADPYANPSVDPYGRPVGPYGGPSVDSTYPVPGPAFDPQASPRYDPVQSYGESPSYRNPYESNPYQPSFGGVTPYGVGPTQVPTPHPQAGLALVLGILGTVLGMGCIVGGLVGIGGIVVGRRVKNEIDAEPGRYTGRSQAVAGLITGIIGVSITVLATVFIVLAIVAGIAGSN
jgi:hypothetical protein